MRINSHNEWDTLRTVVVGTAESFSPGLEVSTADTNLLQTAQSVAMKAFPEWYLDEVSEDLEGLCSLLRQAGASVLRPRWAESGRTFSSPNWSASGYDIYNVRDLQIVFGETLVESAPSSRFRIFESHALRALYYEHLFEEGMRWICAPTPRLLDGFVKPYEQPRSEVERVEEQRHAALSGGAAPVFHFLENEEVIFDAANIMRLGEDLLYLVSSTANAKGAQWLSSILGSKYRMHVTRAYRSSHLDSTILPLRPGLVLLNGARVNESNVPDIFERWERLYFDDPAPLPQEETDHHENLRRPVFEELLAMGVHSHLDQMSSPWAGLNVLSISPEVVLVHDRQISLIRQLETKGLTVQPVQMRHCYTMLGGLHCSTLDLERDSELADYR